MKKTLYVFMIWMAFIAINAFGIEYPEPTSWVNDYAGVLNPEQKQELDAILKEFEDKTTAQIFVAIMDRIPSGTSLEEYVNELFAHWKPGQAGKDNGVLLAIFIQDRKLRIEVGYGLEATLTDAASKLIITNDIAPAFKQGDYYGGIRKGLKSIILTTHKGYTFPSTTEPSSKVSAPRPQPRPLSDTLSAWLGIGFFVVVIVILAIPLSYLVIAFHRSVGWDCSSSGWSSSSSGGFFGGGGSSGGGGFSGGGGGSSGGGGASGGW